MSVSRSVGSDCLPEQFVGNSDSLCERVGRGVFILEGHLPLAVHFVGIKKGEG